MPLIKRPISHPTARLIGALICLPCTTMGGLCCLLACQFEWAAKSACIPCIDDELVNKAISITNTVTDGLFKRHPKLIGLKISEWGPKDLALEYGPAFMALKDQIRGSVLEVINRYNFGAVSSERLTTADVAFIGEQLRDAVFAQFPSKETFDKVVRENGLSPTDKKGLNDCLIGAIKNIVGGDFIKNELNRISTQVEFRHNNNNTANNALIISSQSMFKKAEVTQFRNVSKITSRFH